MGIINDPNSRIQEVLFVNIFCGSLAAIIVALRFWVRWRRVKLWKDDWFMLAATIFGIGLSVDLLVLIQYGFGSHVRDISPTVNMQTALKLLIVGQLCYFTSIGLIKISILFFCLRIDPWMRIPVICMMAFVTALTIATDVGTVFQCTPVAFAWDFTIKGGYCMHRSKFWEALAYLNIITDLIIYFLPVRTLYKVRMSKRQRVILIFIFAMGMFVVLTEVFRLFTLKAPGESKDPMWDNTPCALWSVVEYAVGVICASLPALKPMFARFLGEREDPSYNNNDVPNMTSVYFESVTDTESAIPKPNKRRIGRFAHGYETDKPMADVAPGILSPLKVNDNSHSSGESTFTGESRNSWSEENERPMRPGIAITRTTDIQITRCDDPDDNDKVRWVVHSL